MSPVDFEQSNCVFGPPPDLAEEQCSSIHAFQGIVKGGSCDGVAVVVVAWKPSSEELEKLNQGSPIFLSCLGGLPPHFLTTDFESAKHPQ
jgi:hypothetical protein